MLEDIVYAEGYSGGIDLALIPPHEDRAEEVGFGWWELLDTWGEVYVLTYGEAKLSHTIGEVAVQ